MAYKPLKNPTAFIIKKQVIRVEKLVGERNKFQNIVFKEKIKLSEINNRKKREEKIEGKGEEKTVSNKISTPSLGFLDGIKNFLFSVLLGGLTLKLLPHIPKLKGLLIATIKVGNFGIEFAGTILNAMVTFIDKAYQIIDFGKQQAKMLGGDTGLANYNNMLGVTNKVLNSMLIAGMLFSDLIVLKAESDSNQSTLTEIGQEVTEEITKRQGFRATIQAMAGRIGSVARVAGPIMLAGTAAMILGELTFQQRKFTQNLEKQVYEKLKEAQNDKNPVTKTLKLLAYYTALPGLKYYNFISTAVGSLVDIIGAPFRYLGELINFGIMSLTGDADGIKRQRENLAKFDARVREQIRQIVNTLSLGLLAREKGSWGNIYGDKSAQSEMMSKMYGGGMVMGYASGGEITRGGQTVGGSIGRSEGKKPIARTIEVPVSPLNPGSSVSGNAQYIDPSANQITDKSKIETFFPNPKDPRYVNPYQYLKRSFNTSSMSGIVKPFLQVPIKMIFGDGPQSGDYTALAASANNILNSLLSNTLAPGKDIFLSERVGLVDILNWARKLIERSMSNAVESIRDSLLEQLGLKRTMSDERKQKPRKSNQADNPLSQFGGEAQFVIGDSIARGFAGLGATPGTDADDSKVGRRPDQVLVILKAKGDKLKGALIDLSTGIANDPSQWDVVEQQLSYLKSLGVRVRVLGVGNTYSKEKGGINEKLSQMVSKYGFYFYGGYKGGADKVHATPTDYAEMKSKRDRDVAASTEQSASGIDFDAGKGEGRRVFLHWTAGDYTTPFPAYHATILGDGTIVRNTPYSKDKSGHTAGANRNSVGISVAAAQGATENKMGSFPPTAKQLDTMASEVAKLAKSWGWNKSKVDTNVMTHGEWERYAVPKGILRPPVQRWDLDKLKQSDRFGSGGPTLRNMIKGKMREGGYIKQTGKYLTHEGEYVIDADSVEAFGVDFYDIINQVEHIRERKDAANKLIDILSQYTEDGFVINPTDYTYEIPEQSDTAFVPYYIPMKSSSMGSGGGGSSDPSLDFIEIR